MQQLNPAELLPVFTSQPHDTLHVIPPFSVFLRQQLVPSETERHAVRTDDEVKVDAEDGRQPQRHQTEALQSPSYVLNSDWRELRME